MGYLTTGFLFLAEPPFAAIADAFTGFAARGYRHKVRPVWVLDLWEKPWRKNATHFPLQERFAAIEAVVPPPGGQDDPAFLRELDDLLAALGDEGDPLVAKECRIALGVSRLAKAPTFFFAGDDDLIDVACATDSGRLLRFRCRMGHLTVVHDEGKTEIVPFEPLDEDEDAGLQEIVAAARGAVTWPVTPPAPFDGGHRLHDSALALWPAQAGQPGEPLGVGTWDPAQNLDADFDIVFERT